MRDSNLKLGAKIANYLGKRYGMITYSGTLAIELSLILLDLNEGSNILVSNKVCYSIINTINKLKMNPILINPKNDIYITNEDIDCALKKDKIDCILLVHQYGIMNNINKRNYKNQGIKIIEDIAQLWKIENEDYNIGVDSDIIVTSFGATKPFSYGIGGGLFFDNNINYEIIDFSDNESRLSNKVMYSYMYPQCENIKFDKLNKQSRENILKQRSISKKYSEIIKKFSFVSDIKESIDIHTWHRYPILFEEKRYYDTFVELAGELNLQFQIEHEISIEELPMSKNAKYINIGDDKKLIILIRTRNINASSQLKKLLKIFETIEKM